MIASIFFIALHLPAPNGHRLGTVPFGSRSCAKAAKAWKTQTDQADMASFPGSGKDPQKGSAAVLGRLHIIAAMFSRKRRSGVRRLPQPLFFQAS
jgi:hypothetical protein